MTECGPESEGGWLSHALHPTLLGASDRIHKHGSAPRAVGLTSGLWGGGQSQAAALPLIPCRIWGPRNNPRTRQLHGRTTFCGLPPLLTWVRGQETPVHLN